MGAIYQIFMMICLIVASLLCGYCCRVIRVANPKDGGDASIQIMAGWLICICLIFMAVFTYILYAHGRQF